jgi:hypothetical protein
MASSSSNSFNSSIAFESSREMTSEFNSEACAPLHRDAEEWDFRCWSEDDESLSDGKDLQFLPDGELEDEDDDDNESWEKYDPSSEEEDDNESIEEEFTVCQVVR